MKRLALLWLVCAAVGFAVAAGSAAVIALAFDRTPAPHSQVPPDPSTRQAASDRSGAPPGYTGQRLLGN